MGFEWIPSFIRLIDELSGGPDEIWKVLEKGSMSGVWNPSIVFVANFDWNSRKIVNIYWFFCQTVMNKLDDEWHLTWLGNNVQPNNSEATIQSLAFEVKVVLHYRQSKLARTAVQNSDGKTESWGTTSVSYYLFLSMRLFRKNKVRREL